MPQGPAPPPANPAGRDPASLVKLDDLITQHATAAGVNPDLLRRVIQTESAGRQSARSPKGAIGLGQIMPGTAKDLGGDPTNASDNVRMAATYLRQQLDTFGGDETKALAAYNAGPTPVKKYGGVPPYKETQGYVSKIQGQAPSAPAPTPDPEAGRDPASLVNITAAGRPPDPVHVAPVSGPIGPTVGPPAMPLITPLGGLTAVPTPTTEGIMGLPSALMQAPQRMGEAVGGFLQRQFSTPEGIRNAAEVTIPAGAAIVGGTLGARMGPGGAMAGATTMAPLGEAAVMGVEALTGAPPTMEQAAQRMSTAGGTALLGEGAAQVGAKLLRPFAKSFNPALATEAYDRFTEQVPVKIGNPLTREVRHVLPSEVSNSRALNVIENVVEGSFLGGGKASAIREARQRIAERDVTDALNKLGPRLGTRGAGEYAGQTRDRAIAAFRTEQNKHYADFRAQGGSIPVDSAGLDAFAQEVVGRGKGDLKPGVGLRAARQLTEMFAPPAKTPAQGIGFKGVTPAQATAAVAGVKPGTNFQQSLQQVIQQANRNTDTLTADQANETVKSLGRWMRQLERQTATNADKNQDYAVVSKLYNLAKDDLDASVSKVNPAAFQALERGRDITKTEKDRLFNDTLLAMGKEARTNPSKLTSTLFQKNNSSAIELVERAIGPQGMAPVRAAAMEQVLAPDPVTNRINWKHVLTRIENKYGRDTMSAMFPGQQHEEVAKIAHLMLDLDRKPVGQIGKVAIQLTQAGAGTALLVNPGGMFGSDNERDRALKASAVILGPAVLAKVFASPVGLKWLTMGLTHGANTQMGMRAGTELLAFMAQEGLVKNDQVEKALPPPPKPAGSNPFGLQGPPERPGSANPFGIGGQR